MASQLHRTSWAVILLAALASFSQAQTFTPIYSFGASPDGSNPQSPLIADSKGNGYGTTYYGGANGYGTVFKVDNTGKESVIFDFDGANGANPSGTLTMDSAGNLYGTTVWGGSFNLGVIFKFDTSEQEFALYNFAGGNDGANPESGLVADSSGNVYGTTEAGGTGSGCGYLGCGTVFKFNLLGTETVLHTFTGDNNGVTDGATPWGGVILDSAGNLYGTTVFGGMAGYGTIYKINTTGTETLLHSFAGTDGAYPYAALIADAAGNFYGTAYEGGPARVGTVFKLNQDQKTTVMHAFAGGSDGAYPAAGLLLDSAGNLYGTTVQGGSHADYGTVFKVNASGVETILHSFTGGAGGLSPQAGLISDKAGNLYGTTYYGGKSNNGLIFRLKP